MEWMGSVNSDSYRDSSSVRFIKTNSTHIDITSLGWLACLLTISTVLDRYRKYVDVKFSMFRELIKLGRHHPDSQCESASKFAVYQSICFNSGNQMRHNFFFRQNSEIHRITSISLHLPLWIALKFSKR